MPTNHISSSYQSSPTFFTWNCMTLYCTLHLTPDCRFTLTNYFYLDKLLDFNWHLMVQFTWHLTVHLTWHHTWVHLTFNYTFYLTGDIQHNFIHYNIREFIWHLTVHFIWQKTFNMILYITTYVSPFDI